MVYKSRSSLKQEAHLERPQSLSPQALQAKLHSSDLKFAAVIIQLMTPKLEEGHLSYLEGCGWGFTFTDDTVRFPL